MRVYFYFFFRHIFLEQAYKSKYLSIPQKKQPGSILIVAVGAGTEEKATKTPKQLIKRQWSKANLWYPHDGSRGRRSLPYLNLG